MDIRETASSIPAWGTGSGVLISREITVRIGLVSNAFVVVVDVEMVRIAANANFVNLVANIIDIYLYNNIMCGYLLLILGLLLCMFGGG